MGFGAFRRNKTTKFLQLLACIVSFSLMAPSLALAQKSGGMGPEAQAVIQGLTQAERRKFKSLSRPQRREFIQSRIKKMSQQNNRADDMGDKSLKKSVELTLKLPRHIHIKAGLFNTGVTPIYPTDAECRPVKSFFGDKTRYDGSTRNQGFYQGYHEGFDISLPEGTPLVALADGEVVHKFFGKRLVGHQIYIRHTPEDTGLPIFIYSKYKHFQEPSNLDVGDHVKMGQIVARSGKSGTTGGHFGGRGYPHLHFSVYVSESGEYNSKKDRVSPRDARYMDPMAIYLMKDAKVYDNHLIRDLPASRKKAVIPYKREDGSVVPTDTRLIWPVMCN